MFACRFRRSVVEVFVFSFFLVNLAWGLDPYTYIYKGSGSLDAEVGTTMEIRCDVNSRPNGISVRWDKESDDCNDGTQCTTTLTIDRMPQDQQKYSLKYIPSDTYILIIKNVDEKDEGKYTCQLPLTRIVKVFDSVNLRVTQKPVIDPLLTSSDQLVEAGRPVELTCGAFGRPTPSIRWTRAGNGMMPGGGFVRLGEKLTISQMEPAYRGPYICTAENDVGEVHRTINLDMLFPPEVSFSPSSISQKTGYETRIFCIVEAKPKPTVTWTVGGSEVTGDNVDQQFLVFSSKYKVTTYEASFKKIISKLTIYEVTSDIFSSQITCDAVNEEGRVSKPITVKESDFVQPIPGGVSSAMVQYISIFVLALCWLVALVL